MTNSAVSLSSGEEQLGTWSLREFDVAPAGKGSFRLELGAEQIVFTPTSPAKFAEAMHVPLQPEASSNAAEEPKYDYDAAIDEMIANVKPLKSVNDEDDILSKPLLTGILLVSGALMAGLVSLTVML